MQAVAQSHYTHAKASCYRCGVTSDLVDLDVHIEGEGGLVLCRNCVREAVTVLGIPLKALEAKAETFDQMEEDLRVCQEQYREARKQVRALKKELATA